MINLLDSHCHLHYLDNIEEHMQRITDRCSKLLCVATSLSDTDQINDIIQRFSSQNLKIYSSVGIHPLQNYTYKTLSEIKENVMAVCGSAANLIAIGESGLDDFRDPLGENQLGLFDAQLQVASALNIPLIMHTRSGKNSVVEQASMNIIDQYPQAKIIAHCFGGSFEFMNFLVNRNHLVSFACNLGYKGSKGNKLREIAQHVPLRNIMIETDAPFLLPNQYRGQNIQNSPIHVQSVLELLSNIHMTSQENLLDILHKNFDRFFDKIINNVTMS